MKRNLLCVGCVVFGIVGISMPLVAQDKPAGQDPAGEPNMEEMMKMWVELAKPGPHHKHLDAFTGSWESENKMRFAEQAPWTESKGRAEFKWMLDGRFLAMHVYSDPIPGMPFTHPFEGISLLGYDNASKKYNAVWADNYGTMMMIASGECDASGKTITLRGSFEDPMTNKPCAFRWVYRVESKDAFTMEMFAPDEEGKEFMNGTFAYKRKAN